MQSLLREQAWLPKPVEGRTNPIFWIRRVVFIEDIDHVDVGGSFRVDRRFRRGLNSVWADDSGSGGHGAGKTTLCQLIRYCLGEPSYGPERFTRAVADAFPRGYV